MFLKNEDNEIFSLSHFLTICLSVFSHNFFVETLKIKHEDIPLFLQFAEMPVRDLSLFLKSEYELQLIQYLTLKAKEFKIENQKE